MKIVAEAEPFGSDENVIDGGEEGVVEICVPDHGGKHNGKGEAEVGGKDAAARGLHAVPVPGSPEGVGGGCVVLGVNGEVGSCHGKGKAAWFLLVVVALQRKKMGKVGWLPWEAEVAWFRLGVVTSQRKKMERIV